MLSRSFGYGLLFIMLLVMNICSAQDSLKKTSKLEFRGYIKDLQSVYFMNNTDSMSSSNLIHNRLNFKYHLSSNLNLRLEIRNRLFYGKQVEQIAGFGNYIDQYNGYFKLSKLWVNERSIVIHSVIDRAMLTYSNSTWDIRLGRQRINWGISNVWNPNDIFNAYNFLDFDYEERPGNDALRIQRFLKNNSSLEIAWKPGKKKEQSITALMYKFNKRNYDFQLLGGVCQTDLVAGMGWAGSIKNMGFKGEASYFHPKETPMDTSGVVGLTLMADRTFKNNWYGSVSYLYNSHPSNSLANNTNMLSANLTAKSLYPFRHTLYLGMIKTLTPITTFNASFIYSSYNNTLMLFPSFAWNVAKNFDFDLTAQSVFSEEGSKYRSLVTACFVRFRWSY